MFGKPKYNIHELTHVGCNVANMT